MLFSKAFEVLSVYETGHGSIRAHLEDSSGDKYTLVAWDRQAKTIINNVGGKIFGTIKVKQFSDHSFQLHLESVAVLEEGVNMSPRPWRRKTVFPDLPAEVAQLSSGSYATKCQPQTVEDLVDDRPEHVRVSTRFGFKYFVSQPTVASQLELL